MMQMCMWGGAKSTWTVMTHCPMLTWRRMSILTLPWHPHPLLVQPMHQRLPQQPRQLVQTQWSRLSGLASMQILACFLVLHRQPGTTGRPICQKKAPLAPLFCPSRSQQTTLVLSQALCTSPGAKKRGTGPRAAKNAETLKFLRGRSADACQEVQP